MDIERYRLSDAMVSTLEKVEEAGTLDPFSRSLVWDGVNKRTYTALMVRGLMTRTPAGYELTESGRNVLVSLSEKSRPDGLSLAPDEINPRTIDVYLDRTFVGSIFDETEANLSRGPFAAWSARRGTIGFFPSKEAAARAIVQAFQFRE